MGIPQKAENLMNPRLSLCLAIVACFVGLSACSKPREPEPDVILLHTGRLRGNVYPLSLQNISPLQHYQYLAGYVQSVRETSAKSGARVVLLDLGDSLGGSFASHVTDSMNIVTFFNELRYDAVMLSNLDAEVPGKSLAGIRAKVLNPFVDAHGAPTIPGTSAGVRLDVNKLPIDVLANFYGDTNPAANPGRFPASFGGVTEGVRPIRDYSAILASLGTVPPGGLSLFAWMKFEQTEQPPEAFLKTLSGMKIDAIVAHRIYGGKQREAWQSSGFVDWRPPVSFNILRNNGGFVIARMDLKRDGEGWKVLRHELVPMTANNAVANAPTVAAIEKFAPAIQAADAPLARLEKPMSAPEILALYMRALTSIPDTQAVAYSPESIRSDWSAGELRASGVFNSLPWTSGLVQITLDASQLRQLPSVTGLHVLVGPGEGPFTVTTSRFFASVICGKLSLPASAVTPLAQSSEFDFFTAYLKTNADSLSAETPAGWELFKP